MFLNVQNLGPQKVNVSVKKLKFLHLNELSSKAAPGEVRSRRGPALMPAGREVRRAVDQDRDGNAESQCQTMPGTLEALPLLPNAQEAVDRYGRYDSLSAGSNIRAKMVKVGNVFARQDRHRGQEPVAEEVPAAHDCGTVPRRDLAAEGRATGAAATDGRRSRGGRNRGA